MASRDHCLILQLTKCSHPVSGPLGDRIALGEKKIDDSCAFAAAVACVTVIGLRHRKCERQRQEGTKGARAGPIHGPMISMMIKLGSNRVVDLMGA
jgi:hypothetical protein